MSLCWSTIAARYGVVLLCAGTLSGCALGPRPTATTAPPATKNDIEYWLPANAPKPSGRVAALLLYADYVRSLPAVEYGRETERARTLYAAEKTEFRLLQYTLALAAPRGDWRRAQQLLEPMTRDAVADRELRALATLLYADLGERRRLDANALAQTRRADELERKLDAVKDIERNLMERDSSGGEKR